MLAGGNGMTENVEEIYPKYRIVKHADFYAVEQKYNRNQDWREGGVYSIFRTKFFAVAHARRRIKEAARERTREVYTKTVVWGPEP